MKKIVFFLALGLFSMSCTAQYYPNNDGYYSDNNGWYGDDNYQFPDDYYYEYPSDYYRDDYYQSFYNDYTRSIEMVNWNRFFRDYRLSNYQMEMIMDLNRQFSSYFMWNDYYRMNPNRWYYDRFYALERILGSRLFRVFYTMYYGGVTPVRYYSNYWRDYYRPRYYNYYVVPRYRDVNVNVYRVDPYDYHRSVGNKYGWNQPRNPHNPGGFREGNTSTNRNGNVTNSSGSTQRTGGFRTNDNNVIRSESQNSTNRNNGFRTDAPSERVQRNTTTRPNDNGLRTSEVRRENTRVFENSRNETNRVQSDNGFRTAQPRTENRTIQTPRSENRTENNNNTGRASGMRTGGR